MPTNFPSWGHGREGLESHFREKLQIPYFWSRVRGGGDVAIPERARAAALLVLCPDGGGGGKGGLKLPACPAAGHRRRHAVHDFPTYRVNIGLGKNLSLT